VVTEIDDISDVHAGFDDIVAYNDAMHDEGSVSKVEWLTHPLPGVLAWTFGGCHSLLIVTVGETEYLIEKCGIDNGRNGLFVSLASEVDLEELGCTEYYVLEDIEGSPKMRDLIAVADTLGHYKTGRSNCHHAAQIMYNLCTSEHEKKPAEYY
jgi:hypothetical protein